MGGILKYVMVTVFVIISILAGVIAWFGGFSKVEVTAGTFDEVEVVFTTHQGGYETIGDTWTTFYADLKAVGVNECDGLALYLDPPETPKDDLRSIIGCRTDVMSAAEKSMVSSMSHAIIPASDTFSASFPFKMYMSYFIAPMKVYPAMQKLPAMKGQEAVLAIEVYGVEGQFDKIHFHLPKGMSKADYADFYAAF